MDKRIFRRLVLAGFIQNLALSITGMVDCAVVGRHLGASGLSAMKLAMPVFSLLSLFSTILSTGLSVVVSRDLAKGRVDRAGRAFTAVIEAVLLLALLSMLVGAVCPSAVTALLAGNSFDPAVFSDATDYLKPILLAALPILLFDILGALALLEGADRYMRCSSAVILAVNTLGDLLAVRLHAGIFGIALSSAAAYLCAFLVVAHFFVSGRSMFRIRFAKPDLASLRRVAKAGLPMVMRSVSGIVWPMSINRLMLKYGSLTGLAALSIQDAVHYLPAALCSGIASTTLILTGIYAGEQDAEGLRQMRRQVLRWSLIGGSAIGVALGLAARPLLSLFTDDAQILSLGVTALAFFLGGVPFLAINFSAASFLQGVGRTLASGAVIFVNHVIVAISTAGVLGLYFGANGIFASYWVCELAMTLILSVTLLIVFKKRGPVEPADDAQIEDEMRRDIGSVEEAVAASVQVGEFCRKNGTGDKAAYHIALCAEELAVNSIEHGFSDGRPHHLKLRAIISQGMLILRLRDDCRRFDLVERYRMMNPNDPAKNVGLRIVFASADDVSYSSALDMNNVCVKTRIA